MSNELTDWQQGEPCKLHDMGYCTDCRDLAKIVRKSDGTLGYAGDCAVQTFAEITGASYDEAVTALRDAGYIPGRGTPVAGIAAAFTASGFQAARSSVHIDRLPALSATGRVFFVAGFKGRKGHAWSVVDGKAHRAYRPPFRYQVFEVTA